MVVDASSIIFQHESGVLNVATPEAKVESDSKFLSSSCTKVLTAAAISKLCEKKQVELDAPLTNYCTSHPYGDQVTIRHLLNHSSGIPNPMPLNWLHVDNFDKEFDEDEALQEALKANPKLSFSPGERYAYSNLSYWLLGKVIENVSGMTYMEYMKQEIFEPLGISSDEMTFDRSSSNSTSNFAQGHQECFSLLTGVFWLLTSKKLWDTSSGKWARFQKNIVMDGPAYGGCIASATGYAKVLQDFLLALDGKSSKLFPPTTTKDLIEPQYTSIGGSKKKEKKSLLPSTSGGWNRGQLGTHTYYSKPGGGPGFNSNIRIYPAAKIATVYLCNKTEVSEGPIKSLSDALDKNFL
jgi:D-alanyl-D-alanine carboxypeptidase